MPRIPSGRGEALLLRLSGDGSYFEVVRNVRRDGYVSGAIVRPNGAREDADARTITSLGSFSFLRCRHRSATNVSGDYTLQYELNAKGRRWLEAVQVVAPGAQDAT